MSVCDFFAFCSINVICIFLCFAANIPMRFGRKGDFITASSDPDAADPHNEKTYNQLLIDISTSFTFLLAIFFPSCTGTFIHVILKSV